MKNTFSRPKSLSLSGNVDGRDFSSLELDVPMPKVAENAAEDSPRDDRNDLTKPYYQYYAPVLSENSVQAATLFQNAQQIGLRATCTLHIFNNNKC